MKSINALAKVFNMLAKASKPTAKSFKQLTKLSNGQAKSHWETTLKIKSFSTVANERNTVATDSPVMKMKTIIAFILVASAFVWAGCCSTGNHAKGFKTTYSSFDQPSDHPPEALMSNGTFNLQGLQADPVLAIYQNISKRTVISGQLPSVAIKLQSQTSLSRVQALQLFDTVLAQNGVAMVLSGDNAVKAVPVSQAISENPPEITLPWELLPDSSSMMTRTVRLKHLKAVQVMPVLAPFAKLPNSIIVIQSENLLILRDYSSNIRKQLQLLETLDKE